MYVCICIIYLDASCLQWLVDKKVLHCRLLLILEGLKPSTQPKLYQRYPDMKGQTSEHRHCSTTSHGLRGVGTVVQREPPSGQRDECVPTGKEEPDAARSWVDEYWYIIIYGSLWIMRPLMTSTHPRIIPMFFCSVHFFWIMRPLTHSPSKELARAWDEVVPLAARASGAQDVIGMLE